MNPRTITLDASATIPRPPAKRIYFLHVFGSENGFLTRWVELSECPRYIHPTTGKRARLAMVETSARARMVSRQRKTVLVFEEALVDEHDGVPITTDWNPSEWFPYLKG
jgi:hypothetical protein